MTSNFASELKLMRLSNAFQISCAVHTAARLELGSHLDAQGKTVDELAKLTGVHSRGLGALLGFLVQLEVVAELEPGLYRSTDLTDRLYLVDNIAQGPEGLAAWAGLEGALRTGQTPFEAVHGMPFYDYAALRPEQSHRWTEWNSHASSWRVMKPWWISAAGRVLSWARFSTCIPIAEACSLSFRRRPATCILCSKTSPIEWCVATRWKRSLRSERSICCVGCWSIAPMTQPSACLLNALGR